MVANNKNTNDTSINRNDIVWYPALKDIFCYVWMNECMYACICANVNFDPNVSNK